MSFFVTKNRCGGVPLADIPVMPYARFHDEVLLRMGEAGFHCANYFGVPSGRGLMFYFIGLDDTSHEIFITSWESDYYDEESYPSLTAHCPALHGFEREITENYGIRFSENPYEKPLRFAHDRADTSRTINNYPFYTIEGHSVHEVNVGPIHAGIIEPGAFRFQCNGEEILHLEIVLGYQHRGLERLMRESASGFRRCLLAEGIAGDSTIAHTTAYVQSLENLLEFSDRGLDRDRLIALELERIAMHLADTGALCMDVGYQLGQVACEALRTIVINTTQLWCGNRFGRALIRPFGTNYPLMAELAVQVIDNVKEVRRRYDEVCRDVFSSPSVLARFEECGTVSRQQMFRIGGVGMAARASGLVRDLRTTHPWGVWESMIEHTPVVEESGDVQARAMVRSREVLQSADYITKLLYTFLDEDSVSCEPEFDRALPAEMLSVSLVEGWRGEICHVALTGAGGELAHYKIKDPSFHNWYALSLAVRGLGISDFPVNNKSFNLSYCGFDL